MEVSGVDILPLTFDPSFSLRRIMSNGLLALLYLPVGTLLSTDGKMVTLKRHDESSDVTCNCFHLVTCRIQASLSSSVNNNNNNNNNNNTGASVPPHGFLFLVSDGFDAMNHGNCSKLEWMLAHE
jgi:hypothetical protein